jgi:hypothetical protein
MWGNSAKTTGFIFVAFEIIMMSIETKISNIIFGAESLAP